MARKPRFVLPGVPQHIVQRGHDREPCFYASDNYWRFRTHLQDAANANQVAIHAYVLMTNHGHLFVMPGQEHGVTHMTQDLGRKYVRSINNTYRCPAVCGKGASRPA